MYAVLAEEAGASPADVEGSLRRYFQLGVDVAGLYQQWCASDPHFRHLAGRLPGVRILCQDPVENLFSFICSSCNNIVRISDMVRDVFCGCVRALFICIRAHRSRKCVLGTGR
jgi:N-glycosylase/DNA lyase